MEDHGCHDPDSSVVWSGLASLEKNGTWTQKWVVINRTGLLKGFHSKVSQTRAQNKHLSRFSRSFDCVYLGKDKLLKFAHNVVLPPENIWDRSIRLE